MRVLLVYPLAKYVAAYDACWTPLGLSYIAGMLRKEGNIVSIFDRVSMQARTRNKNEVNEAMLRHIDEFKPDLIGFNTVTPLIYDTIECVELIIASNYRGLMIAGGHHTTAMPLLSLKKIPGLNGVIEGEGEFALSRLASGESPGGINGLWWRNGQDILHTVPKQIEDLDQLPFPAMDLLDMKYYLKPSFNTINGHYLSAVSMLTSRGCIYKCDFCTESLTYGKGIRFHSIEYIIENLKKMLKDYSFEAVYFHDNDFLIDENRFYKLCESITACGLHKKLKWCIQTRAGRIKAEVLKTAKAAGCIKIEMGIESPVQWQLDMVRKSSTTDENEKAIALCRKMGISVHAYMIAGFEGERIPDLDQKLQWIKRNRPNTFSLGKLKIHPGTRLYSEKGCRFFENNDWTEKNIREYYTSFNLAGISWNEIDDWFKKYYKQYAKRQHWINIIKANPKGLIVFLLLNTLIKKFKSLSGKIFRRFKELMNILFGRIETGYKDRFKRKINTGHSGAEVHTEISVMRSKITLSDKESGKY